MHVYTYPYIVWRVCVCVLTHGGAASHENYQGFHKMVILFEDLR